jgi:hypothetical protein
MTGDHWMGTFRAALLSGDEKLIASVLETICKTERKDAMVAAAKLVTAFDAENAELDTVVRNIAREILDEALQ